MVRIVGAMFVVASLAPSAFGQSRNDLQTMIRLWTQANLQCRGESGDKKSTLDACEEREAYSKRLGQLGWCYGREGEAGYQYRWHPCGRGSIKGTQ